MEKVSAKARAKESSGANRPHASAAPSRAQGTPGNLALQAISGGNPLGALAGYLGGGATGEAIPAADRAPVETATGQSLSPSLLHRGPAADAILGALGARGATAGRHVFINSGIDGNRRGSVLRHELAHVAQAGGRMPDLGRPLRLGRDDSTTERQAHRVAANPGFGMRTRLFADANLVQLDRCPGGCHQPSPGPKIDWNFALVLGPGVPVKTPQDILAAQPKTIEEELEGYEQNLLATRTTIFDQLEKDRAAPPQNPFGLAALTYGAERLPVGETLPPDLKKRYAAAIAAAAAVQAGIDSAATSPGVGEVPIETREDARPTINAYYLALQEFAAAVDTAQLKRDESMRAAKAQEAVQGQLKPPPCPNCHSATPTAPRSLLPDPPPLSLVPAQMAKNLPTITAALTVAETVDQWKQVEIDLKGSVIAMDQLLIAVLPEFSKEADTLGYLQAQKAELEKFGEVHPGAVPIPAVFYPKNRWAEEKVPGGNGTTVQIPQSIPWRFYLYHSSEKTKNTAMPGEWRLVDMTSPMHHVNTEPTWGLADAFLDPPRALFAQLNSKYRFPEGKLHWTYPSGIPGELETTEPATASDWLGWIGMGLAAIALIAGTIVTFGLAAPATLPALAAIGTVAGLGAAGFGIASTVTGMHEKEKYGLLTEEDKNRAVLSIAFDIIGALALGLGRLAVAAEAGAQAARTGARVSAFARTLAALNGRYFFMISRSASVMKVVGLGADATQLLTTTADFIKAFNAIRAQPGLADADRETALVKLVSTSLLTGTLMMISVRSGIKDIRGGTLHMSGVDERGRILVSGEEGIVPHGKAGALGAPAPRTVQSHLDSPGTDIAPGWSRKKIGPQIDPGLPEGRVEVRIVRDEAGRIIDAQTFHHAGADADSIKIHEEIAVLVRTEGAELRALVHDQRKLFGGEPPPLELQLELKKLFDEMAAAEKKLASGKLGKDHASDVKQKLNLLQHEIDNVKAAMADPSLRSAYPTGVVGLPVKPTELPKKGQSGELVKPPGYPDPPAGHMYEILDGGSFVIRPKAGYKGAAKFSLEEVDGKFVASNRVQMDSEYGGRQFTPMRQAELEALGYVFQSNGVVRRPPGHAKAGQPRMVPIEIDPQGRVQIVEGAESLGEMQVRLREALPKTQVGKLEKLEASATAAGKKVVLVEGIYDTGVTWNKVLTLPKRLELEGILIGKGVSKPDVDRLINGLVEKGGTLKVVLGTEPVRRAAPYRDLFADFSPAPAGKVEVHHGDPLYLGGGHDPALLFGVKTEPHDVLHSFFDDLVLPVGGPFGGTRLQSGVIQNKVKSVAKPAAAVVDPVTGDVRYEILGK